MRKILKASVAALALAVAVPAVAHAQQVGTVASVSGPQGSVLVVRGSETYFLSSGDALFAGDQIFVRSEGSVELSGSGCSVPLSANSSMTLGADMCQSTPVDFNGDVPGANGATGAGEIAAAGPVEIVGGAVAGANPAVLAVAGIVGVGGIAAAASDGDSSTPSSP